MYDLTGLAGIKYNENIYHYTKNLQGDIIGLLDVNNEQIVSYEYDSWGSLISIKDQDGNVITDENNIGIINPFRYREYYYDSEIGMYYLNSRYYNPSWGRFINADGYVSTGRGILGSNMYIYCNNNCVNYVDDSGQFFGTSVATGTGIAIGISSVMLGIIGLAQKLPELIQRTYNYVDAAISNTKDKVSEMVDNAKEKTSTKGHTVYTLVDSDGVVQYVGRTTDYEKRMYAHSRSLNRGHLLPGDATHNLKAEDARGLEQSLIIKFETLNKNNPANNQINGVSRYNNNCVSYLEAAQVYLSENEIYVGYCYQGG